MTEAARAERIYQFRVWRLLVARRPKQYRIIRRDYGEIRPVYYLVFQEYGRFRRWRDLDWQRTAWEMPPTV